MAAPNAYERFLAEQLADPEFRAAFEQECRDLRMSPEAFARFDELLDTPAEVVPEMVRIFRPPRIEET